MYIYMYMYIHWWPNRDQTQKMQDQGLPARNWTRHSARLSGHTNYWQKISTTVKKACTARTVAYLGGGPCGHGPPPRKVRKHYLTRYNLYILLKSTLKMQEMPFQRPKFQKGDPLKIVASPSLKSWLRHCARMFIFFKCSTNVRVSIYEINRIIYI